MDSELETFTENDDIFDGEFDIEKLLKEIDDF